MIQIPLRSRKYTGLVALIDECDYDRVSELRWWPRIDKNATYAFSQIERKTIYLHRFIVGPDPDNRVDHINHDGLDNRRCNLRICTNSENLRNRSGLAATNRSGFLGIETMRDGSFRATLSDHGKNVHVGVFRVAQEAAIARDIAARKLYGDFGVYNFPLPGEKGVGL